MSTQHYLQILRDLKDVAFATVDAQGHPQVRIVDVMYIEDGKLFFVTARGKAFYQELCRSGETAIVGMTTQYLAVRLNGKVRKMEERIWVEKVFEHNPGLADLYPPEKRYILEAFCLYEGYGEAFDLGVNPPRRESFYVGESSAPAKGFFIGEECTGCGTCVAECPISVISEGRPCIIDQDHCLHCGTCAVVCPAKAVHPLTEARG